MKICKNCERYFKIPRTETTPDWSGCNRPNPHLVTGEQVNTLCHEERRYFNLPLDMYHCGLDGKFFKDKK